MSDLIAELLKAAKHDEAEGGFAYILLRSAAMEINDLRWQLAKKNAVTATSRPRLDDGTSESQVIEKKEGA